MGLLEDCFLYFGTNDLYEMLEVGREAKDSEIKKAFRKLSLKCHPDRHPDADQDRKLEMTRKFQTLSKVHFILSDPEKRAFYDESGLVLNEENLEQEADWGDYFRVLFPKVSGKDIANFMAKYTESEDEKQDLKTLYTRYEGDMDKISESLIGFDEERTRGMLLEMIAAEEVPKFDNFVNEAPKKKDKRRAKAVKEAKMAEKEAKRRGSKREGEDEDADEDLVNAIQSRSKGRFNSIISQMEAKYGKVPDEDEEPEKKGRGSKGREGGGGGKARGKGKRQRVK